MANNRKLQAELDRTLKKVDEGINIFNEIWDKVYSASTQSQKEKYETDLKKEIKKLQRVREILKNWMTGNEFKDKSKIQVAKKRIERKMEEFKVCERETKTKAYSREGLAKAGKLDPEEKKRQETRGWIQQVIDDLNLKIESCEFSIEESSNEDEIADIQTKLEAHKWHIQKLEMITRALDNQAIDPESIDDIKEDIDYYLEFCEDMNFYHDDEIYDQLDIGREFLTEKTAVPEVVPAQPVKEKKKKKNKKKKKTGDIIQTKESKALSAHEKLLEQQKERLRLLEEEEEKRKEAKKKEQETTPVTPITNATKNFSSVFAKPVEQQPITSPKQKPIQQSTPLTSPNIQPIKEPIQQSPSPIAVKPEQVTPKVNINVLDVDSQHVLLETSFLHIPNCVDSNEEFRFKSENPIEVPDCFPTTVDDGITSTILFESLDLDTLFLIFYHQQGTYQQYLASIELKKRSWYFYKKTSKWFMRNEEPTTKEKEYEIGTYEFFDADKTWSKIIANEFKLEYKFLENELKI